MRRFFRFIVKMVLWLVLILAVGLAGAWLFGPRTPVDTTIRFDPQSIGSDIDAYLKTTEQAYSDIRPGLEKQVIWADPASRAKTPIAIVYLHGFSASSGEIRPVPDMLARRFGANLYLARLAGHGRSSDAMGEITVNAWVNDVAEALAIGKKLGDKVVVVSTSTGGSLVSWAFGQKDLASQIDAAIFISPNYGVKADGAFLLTLPFAKQMAYQIVGPRRSFEPENDLHRKFWTYEYPTDALLPMAEFVKLAHAQPFESFTVPALFIISDSDLVVDPALTRAVVARWGGTAQLEVLPSVDDPYKHVLAGDALSPSTTESTAKTMGDWIEATLR